MNRALPYLILASIIGASSLQAANLKWAAEASDVKVKLADVGPNAHPINIASRAGGDFSGKPWGVVNIPIELRAVGTPIYTGNEDSAKASKLPARYVKELKVTVYALFKKAARAREKKGNSANPLDYYLVQKEMTYVNIPTDKAPRSDDGFDDLKKIGGGGYAKMNVGLFLPPVSLLKLSGYDDTDEADPKKGAELAAVAVVSTANGLPTRPIQKKAESKLSSNELISAVFDKKLQSEISGKRWWEGNIASKFSKSDAEVLCISETPFAHEYAKDYPATKPLYGAPEVSGSSTAAKDDNDEGGTSTTTESDD